MEGLSIDELNVSSVVCYADHQSAVGKESAKIGQGKAMKNKWITKGNSGKFVKQVCH
jgi:hypothetical protein